jgi:hypothetical protein
MENLNLHTPSGLRALIGVPTRKDPSTTLTPNTIGFF